MLLELCIASSPEPAGQQAAAATVLLQRGDVDAAQRIHRQVLGAASQHASSWSNLAALAVGLGDATAARAHARRALSLDPRSADAWVNFGVASWHAGVPREAAQATHRALQLAPGMETAALNLALMFRAVQQPEQARKVLAGALAHDPKRARLQQELASVCRLLGDTDATRHHALAALAALLPLLAPRNAPAPAQSDGEAQQAGHERDRMYATMVATCDRLTSAGIEHHLIGGVVLGIAREGEPFLGDKDVDLNLPADTDRNLVASLFSAGFTFMRVPERADARRWCMGFTDDATGIGVDLFFPVPAPGGGLRINAGWPDELLYDYPECVIGTLQWRGRDWPVPTPLPAYLASNFGEDWRSPRRAVGTRSFYKRWFDTQLSSPGLVAESVPRAMNLGLLRLLAALQGGQWEKALALCDQLQALQPLEGVASAQAMLLGAGIA